MGTIILVCNHKGGVGKTMLSAHIAAGAMRKGMRVAAIDTDPQGSLAEWHKRAEQSGHEFPPVYLMRPANYQKELPELQKKYDAIVIDTPPSSAVAIEMFRRVASLFVVPITPGALDLDGLRTTLAALPQDKVHLVLNRWDAYRGAREVRDAIAGLELPTSIVRDLVAFRDASGRGGTVLERYPNGPAADDVRELSRVVWS